MFTRHHAVCVLLATALGALCLLLSACASASRHGALDRPHGFDDMLTPTEYVVSLAAPQTQTAQISMTVHDVKSGSLDVCLPVWRPGRYQVLDQAGTISAVLAKDANGKSLKVVKIDKSTWRISLAADNAATAAGGQSVTVSYRLYANSLNDRTRHIDDTHAFLSPAAAFLYVPERRLAPIRVRVDAPQDWRVSTGLEQAPDAANTFVAPDYDVLVDSPLEIGLHDLHTFDVDGVPHEIVIWHAGTTVVPKPIYDAEQMKRDFAEIVRVQKSIFGDMPYSRYVFQIHSGAGLGGGTEHLNSTIMQTSRATFEDEATYKRFLGLVSHEMFHTWNVKQLRPADLKPYDYAHEDYTRLLWLVEGATSYYDDLCLVRAGLQSPDAFIGAIEGMIASELGRPGWKEQSLEESSFDAWIKFNKTTPDSPNTTVSFYSKGALVSLLLDLEIRSRTENRASFDDLFRTMYQRFPIGGPGYTTQDVLDTLQEISGSSFNEFFEGYIAGTAVPEFDRYFGVVGLECVLDKSGPRQEDAVYLGLTLIEKEGKTLVSGVLSDGPAYLAGLMTDDEIVAMNGQRLKRDDLDKRLRKLSPADRVTFTFFRREELRSLDVVLAGKSTAKWTLRRVKEPTAEQREAYRSWFNRDWD